MRIAFTEDDRQLRKTISRGLAEAGYTVDQAGTGAQLLALVGEHEYDAIVLDILIPAPNGIEVCRTIRATGNRVPILMLTALDAVEQRIAGLDAGADDYLTKPFDYGELLARLRAITRRHSDASATRLAVGDLIVDTARRDVARGGRPIHLTTREYAFLVYMMQHRDRVVLREELLNEVWDGSNNTYSNVLDVYAARLRRKIDLDGAVSLLTTVRGVGFMLAEPA
jgi:two-component system copper resistance phosphate regulon response regulator CusR